jgi:hypothetical protein
VGATNLFNSISQFMPLTLLRGVFEWHANLFLVYLFDWIAHPKDIDGDGKCTVTDSYKYASANTNIVYKNIKVSQSNQFELMFDLYSIRNRLEEAKKAKKIKEADRLEFILLAKTSEYEQILDIQFNHQESWILNAIPALNIEI